MLGDMFRFTASLPLAAVASVPTPAAAGALAAARLLPGGKRL